jgi:hypothetical protein
VTTNFSFSVAITPGTGTDLLRFCALFCEVRPMHVNVTDFNLENSVAILGILQIQLKHCLQFQKFGNINNFLFLIFKMNSISLRNESSDLNKYLYCDVYC